MASKILFLHNIRSAHNIGAMFRTAEAAGIDEVILSGYSPGPLDRFGREDKKVTKASLGAHEMIRWKHVEDSFGSLKGLQEDGYSLAAVEQHVKSIDYKTYIPQEKQVIIMGNEVTGVEQSILELADTILEIPMAGQKESLNVSTACGIVLFRVFNK